MDVLLLISRCLSYSVITLSFFMKLPQVMAILQAKSATGVNVRGYWMEIGSYLIGASYGYFHGFHVSTYVEGVLLAVQSCTIILLAVHYGRMWNIEIAFFSLITCTFVSLSLTKAIPASFLYTLLLSTLPLAAGSKLVQIRELHRLKKQGDVSLVSWSLAAYGCAARLITVAVEIKDTQIFVNFLVSMLLNIVVVLQCLLYSKNKQKVI